MELVFRDGGRVTESAYSSFWMEQALASENAGDIRILQGASRYDVCIIGGGFTGLWAALRLKERDPAISVAVLEADRCGSGASGRNGGAMTHWWTKLPALLARLGANDAEFMLRASIDILNDIEAFVSNNGIECHFQRGPAAWSATTRSDIGAWNGMFAAAEKLGIEHPYHVLSAQELRERFGVGPYYASIVEPSGIRVQPALLARGLRRLAIARGVSIFEHSPVRTIRSEAEAVEVATSAGQVKAQQVVMAANAWMAHLPPFRSRITVVSADIVMTDPIPELLEERGLSRRPGGVNARAMMNFGGITSDGRVHLGRGGGSIAYAGRIGRAFDRSLKQAAEVEQDFRYLFPELRDVAITRCWSGPVDRSASGMPSIGRLSDRRILYAIGFTGHGVAAAAMAGYALSASIVGAEDQWTRVADCLRRMQTGIYPPEPVRYIAAKVIRAAVVRKENAAKQGRAPSWLDRRLAGFASASLPSAWSRGRSWG